MNRMKKKAYLFLIDKSVNSLEKAQELLHGKKFGDLFDNEKKRVVKTLAIGVLFLSIIIFDRLIVLSPKILAQKLSDSRIKIYIPYNSFWLSIAKFFYSQKHFNNIFVPIISDWREEYFKSLFKKEIWKARWINVRYTYAFLVAMWQKSPLGDLIEFISKFAK